VNPCHGVFGAIAGGAVILCGLSWLYWLREIGEEVNNTLPTAQRASWGLLDAIPSGMHWLWNEHGKLFPKSRKRMYAAVSILLGFLIPIAALTICMLVGGVP
jgi:hypothetical protein